MTTFWPKYDWTIIVHFIHCLLDAKLEGGLYLNWELRNGVFSLRNWDEYDWELRIDPSWDWEIRILAWENEPEVVEKWERHFILRIEKVLFDLFIWEKYQVFSMNLTIFSARCAVSLIFSIHELNYGISRVVSQY